MPFLQKTGLRLVYFSLGEAVYKVPLHIGGSHSALLSRHPDIRKRQSAVMHYIYWGVHMVSKEFKVVPEIIEGSY